MNRTRTADGTRDDERILTRFEKARRIVVGFSGADEYDLNQKTPEPQIPFSIVAIVANTGEASSHRFFDFDQK